MTSKSEQQTTGLFPDAPLAVSLRRQIAAASREVFQRQRVYPRLVSGGKMTQAEADEEIACMKAIVETLRELEMGRR